MTSRELVMEFPHLEISIDNRESLVKECRDLVARLRPDWTNLRERVFSEGITNVLVGIFQEGLPEKDMILIRLYGYHTEEIIDRQAEIANMKLLHASGCGAELFSIFKNGMAYSYIPGVTPTSEMILEPKLSQLVIEMLAKMHKMRTGGPPILWDRMRKYLELCPDGFPDNGAKAARYRECGIMSKKQMSKEIDELELVLKTCNSPIVFCHNDLLLGNIIYNQALEKVTFIDLEYGSMNYQALDIGNHFCEFVGVNGVLDFETWYPKEKLQKDWIGRYLKAFNNGKKATTDEIHETYVLVNKFSLCANLSWGMWTLVQAKNSNLDFDFIYYASQKLNEYVKRKDQFLALK